MPRKKRPQSPLDQKRDEIRAWFDNCDPKCTQDRRYIKYAVRRIWERQTLAEQTSEETRDDNGIGYGAFDAKFAAIIINWKGMMTEKLAFAARKMIRKYARQLAEMKLAEEASNDN